MSQADKNTVIISESKLQSISLPTDPVQTKTIRVNDIMITTIPEAFGILNDSNFDNIGLVSYDVIFAPYTTASSHSVLPSWDVVETGIDTTNSLLNPFNPRNIFTNGSISSGVQTDVFYQYASNSQLYNGFTNIGTSSNENINPFQAMGDGYEPLIKNVRGVGFKMPAVFSGWGVGIDGKPVPSLSDSGSGVNFYHPSGLSDPSLWKSGPLNVGWDDAIGMWSYPIHFEIFTAQEDFISDGKGINIATNEEAIVFDYGFQRISSGDIIGAHWSQRNRRWEVIEIYTDVIRQSSESGSEIFSSEPYSEPLPSDGSGSGGASGGSGGDGGGSGGLSGGSGASGSDASGSGASGSGGGSGGGGGGSGSGKDTAIVKASWTKDGYTALYALETPEVRFDDLLIINLTQIDSVAIIDPKFIEVCEKGTIEVCGHSVNLPITIGMIADENTIKISFAEQNPDVELRIVARVSAIRKGFLGVRFPNKTESQYNANEYRLNIAPKSVTNWFTGLFKGFLR